LLYKSGYQTGHEAQKAGLINLLSTKPPPTRNYWQNCPAKRLHSPVITASPYWTSQISYNVDQQHSVSPVLTAIFVLNTALIGVPESLVKVKIHSRSQDRFAPQSTILVLNAVVNAMITTS